MEQIKTRYRLFFLNRASLNSFVSSLFFLLASLIINYFASQYAYVSKSNFVTDILLDNLPIVHVEWAFILGTIVFLIFIINLMIIKPERLAFIIKTIALFVIIRSVFISLTHIGPSPMNTLSAPGEIGRAFTSGADLFFSGHTGMPYLFALIYWSNPRLRYIFIMISIISGFGVLIGHIHYSIDVASAFFITHGIFMISTIIFKKDYDRSKKQE